MLNSNEQIYFWSTIMRDHSEFFLLSLSSKETEFIKICKVYKNIFTNIACEAENQNFVISDEFLENIYSTTVNFVGLKQEILRKLMLCDININLNPTFINHMINEAIEFLKSLQTIKSKIFINPIEENINIHKVWLPDASGHATAIISHLDPTENNLIKSAKKFKSDFDTMFIKATELGLILERTGLNDNSLNNFNKQVCEKTKECIIFLNKIMILRVQCKVLGFLNPLLTNHMIREEQYYLNNINTIINKKMV